MGFRTPSTGEACGASPLTLAHARRVDAGPLASMGLAGRPSLVRASLKGPGLFPPHSPFTYLEAFLPAMRPELIAKAEARPEAALMQ